MDALVGLYAGGSRHHVVPDMSTTGWIAMKSCRDIHGSQTIMSLINVHIFEFSSGTVIRLTMVV